MQNNLMIRCENDTVADIVNIDIKGKFNEHTMELKFGDHFNVEKLHKELLITIYKEIVKKIFELVITFVQNEEEVSVITIQDVNMACSHHYKNTSNGFVLHTHNSFNISDEIESIANVDIVESDIKFTCCGIVNKMSYMGYKGFSKKYAKDYFTTHGKFLSEAIQFPPLDITQSISKFAHRVKQIMCDSKLNLFVVFSHYNAMENLKFLNLEKYFFSRDGEVPDSKERLLLLHPNGNTFVNIRYTETENADVILKQFRNGEDDIRHFSVINREYLLQTGLTFINVVAAPNFIKSDHSKICKECHLMDKDILSSNIKTQSFLDALLSSSENITTKESKDAYMNIVGQIMCFMATMKTIFNVPTLSEDIHKRLSTFILSTQQLRCLYSESRKKIIIGPLGSGKTVLAIAHLELLCKSPEAESVTYYIVWNDKTILTDTVKRFAAKKLNLSSNSNINIVNVVALAKDLNLSKVPSLSQLIASLLMRHGNIILNLIVDEIAGEIFDTEEASILRKMFSSEHSLQNSLVVLFPQSLEKHRKFLTGKDCKVHDGFKYQETDMDVLYLNKAMRTPRNTFNFLSKFEFNISNFKTVIKHPILEAIKFDSNDQEEERIQEKQLLNIITGQKEEIHKSSSMHTGRKDALFEIPVDIDVIAAKLKGTRLSNSSKTLTTVNCNSADTVGHHIQGEKPIFIHVNVEEEEHGKTKQEVEGQRKREEKDDDEEEEEDDRPEEIKNKILVMLALALENVCFDCVNVKRLFFHHTVEEMNIFRKVLSLLNKNFLLYNAESQWEFFNGDNTFEKRLPEKENFNLITDVNGSRGSEFPETICAINPNDTRLQHVTLEGMSRTTNRLILVSSHCMDSIGKRGTSTGNIIKRLLSEYLVEISVECAALKNEDCPYLIVKLSDRKSILYVNTRCWRYAKLLQRAGEFKFEIQSLKTMELKQMVRSIEPPEMVDIIGCVYSSETSCTIYWKDNGYSYLIGKQDLDCQLKYIDRVSSTGKYVICGLELNESYRFGVVASNRIGQSKIAVMPYRHSPTNPVPVPKKHVSFKDIVKLIADNNITEMHELILSCHDIQTMRDAHGFTPLMHSLLQNKCIMTRALISLGSDVLAENNIGRNSYHLAALSGRDQILEILCEHDAKNVNCVDRVEKKTPLHFAMQYHHFKCIDVLLNNNADTNVKDVNGLTPHQMRGWDDYYNFKNK